MDVCSLHQLLTPSQRARLLDAVAHRKSVRTMVGGADIAQQTALKFTADKLSTNGVRVVLSSADQLKLYRSLPFVDTIVGSNDFAAVIIDKETPRAALYAGIIGEIFCLEAVALGLGTCFVESSYNKKYVDVPLLENEKLLFIISFGEKQKEKHRPIKRKKLSSICRTDPSQWPLWAYESAECVRVAPSKLNRQPWKLSYEKRMMMLEKDIFASDVEMGIALLHMSLGVKEQPHIIRLFDQKQIATLYVEEILK